MASSNPPPASTPVVTIEIAVGTPTQARPNAELYPPLVLCLVSETDLWDYVTYFVQLFFIHRDDDKHETLHRFPVSCKVSDSGHELPASLCTNGRQAYFYFPDLMIPEPGRWRVLATLEKVLAGDDGGTRTQQKIVTPSIYIDATASQHARPSMYSSLY
jgi:hypothetical protein